MAEERDMPPAKVQKTSHQGVRRSQRYSTAAAAVVTSGHDLTASLDESSESDRKNTLADQKEIAEEGVKKAIKGLARMEKRLARAVKIQKIEVEKSNVPVRKDDPREHAFKPRPTGNGEKEAVRQNQPKKKRPAPTVKKEEEDDEYEDGAAKDDECVHDDENALADAVEAPEKGAARPPPVNSQYLPLPWKGRLGYVCHTTCSPVFLCRSR
jgi:UV DNA damage endonuclease